MFSRLFFIILFYFSILNVRANAHHSLLVEAESFENKGGWVVDQQFMDLMGSPYLMAHGMGKPVDDATTRVIFPSTGNYNIFVRTYNWTSPWSTQKGAGKFTLSIDNKNISIVLGEVGNKWYWQKAGKIKIKNKNTEIVLKDLTGFDGRCDAIFFTTDNSFSPPETQAELLDFRKKQLNITPKHAAKYDFVVVGGGIAGICAAVASARLGLKVALINDRPVWGGNNSSEVRVHLGGQIGLPPYRQLGGIVNELSPSSEGNAQPAEKYEDWKKADLIDSEPNIDQYHSYRAFAVSTKEKKIESVTIKHILTGEELIISAPLFADCTGDGTIGVLAGADYMYGRESKTMFGEPSAPEISDRMTMGSSVQWYSKQDDNETQFPIFEYGMNVDESRAQNVTMGEWTWETGMNYDQITDFERVRDYGLFVIYSNWSFLKNRSINRLQYADRSLDWVAYVAGKRESRRLKGDYVLKEQDLLENNIYPDGTACSTWSIDLHYPDPENSKQFPGKEFLSIAEHRNIYPYPIPYRCLYSANVDNLFMAGRNISVTHIALGTMRVMRTTGMLGEVIGMAAAVCKQNNTEPRGVYRTHFEELKKLMSKGVSKLGTETYPSYNLGSSLQVPVILDTDFGPDYDDVGAVALLHHAADNNFVRPVAMILSNKHHLSAPSLNVINTYFDRPMLPIGAPKGDALNISSWENWLEMSCEKYTHSIKSTDEIADAVQLYRKSLAEANDRSIVIISIGFLTNLRDLLISMPDEYSDLTGMELIKRKVSKLVIMAGEFPVGKESNINGDPEASKYTIDHWPTKIIFSGAELGRPIKTGVKLINDKTIKNNPVKDIYQRVMQRIERDRYGRSSYDQTAVMFAAYGCDKFFELERGTFILNNKGENTWKSDLDGNHYKMILKGSEDDIRDFIEERMMYIPIHKRIK